MILLVLLLIPLATGVLLMVFQSPRALTRIIGGGAVLLLLYGSFILVYVARFGPVSIYGEFIYADMLSAFFIFVVSLIGSFAGLYSIGYLQHERRTGLIGSDRKLRTYYLLTSLFVTTMLLSVSTGNLGVLWISIEATTLISALLVGYYKNPATVDAAWKYLVICSVGISFALFGTLMLYYSSVKILGETSSALNFTTLLGVAAMLDPQVVKLAFLFILIGYGTKAGLAPMHTWLPDAHSEAPTPMSALLSGVLLSCAIYGILRFYPIVTRCLGEEFTHTLLLILGLFSMGVAAFLILVQKNLKKLLAYSSLEHMGIITAGIGMGSPLALYGAVFHVLNHAVTKSLVFFVAGNLIQRYGTQEIENIQGVVRRLPFTGTCLIIGTLAITGSPPFGIFISEFLIVSGGFREQHFLASILFLVFTVTIFVGFIHHLIRMAFVRTTEGAAAVQDRIREPWGWQTAGIVLALVPVILLGIIVPVGLDDILHVIVKSLS